MGHTVKERLQTLSKEIVKYRQIHSAKCRLPASIWTSALSFSNEVTLTEIAIQLNLSPSQLWKWQKKAKTLPVPAQSKSSQFMEMVIPAATSQAGRVMTSPGIESVSDFQIELQRSDGTRIRIQNPRAHGLCVHTFLQAFMAGR